MPITRGFQSLVDEAMSQVQTRSVDEVRALLGNFAYLLYCAAGRRSALATKTLQDMGMRNASHLGGGYTVWAQAGAPSEMPEAPRAKESR